jgi:Ca-activated chloride channel family protein
LLAAAANGMGKVEQALGWVNKAASVGSPDGSGELSRASRALASAFIASAFEDAKRASRGDEAERLLTRARSLASENASSGANVRVILTWSHPELHPALWSSAFGGSTLASNNFPLFGVAEASSARDSNLEIRLDREDAERAARLGAEATLTAIMNEGAAEQSVSHMNVKFGSAGQAVERIAIRVANGALKQEAP